MCTHDDPSSSAVTALMTAKQKKVPKTVRLDDKIGSSRTFPNPEPDRSADWHEQTKGIDQQCAA